MTVSYKKLFKLLIDKDLLKKDLMECADISQSTLSKLSRGDNVTADVLVRICCALDCKVDELVSQIQDVSLREQIQEELKKTNRLKKFDITLNFESGDKAGKDVRYDLAKCLENQWIEIVD